ncbi:MAG: hypothetical protein GXO83_13185 [Chlorobi bacterium]|nr:hypothetical protein [Chlorobiota bacterium]
MENEPKNTAGQGFGIAALVLGIIALLIAFIPCIGMLALIPGVIGIVFAIVGLNQAAQANAAKGLVVAALVISILGTTIAVVWVFALSSSSFMIKNNLEKITREFNKEFSKEYGKPFDEAIQETSKNLEKELEQLELAPDSLVNELEQIEKPGSPGEAGQAAGKALKEINKELTDTTRRR